MLQKSIVQVMIVLVCVHRGGRVWLAVFFLISVSCCFCFLFVCLVFFVVGFVCLLLVVVVGFWRAVVMVSFVVLFCCCCFVLFCCFGGRSVFCVVCEFF